MRVFVKLHTVCPACGVSLLDIKKKIDNEPAVALVTETGGKRGMMYLSSLFGSYTTESDFPIQRDDILIFYCPSCREQFKSVFQCDACQAPLVWLPLDGGGRINFCSRKGCNRHFLEYNDTDLILKRLFDSYSFGQAGGPDAVQHPLTPNDVEGDLAKLAEKFSPGTDTPIALPPEVAGESGEELEKREIIQKGTFLASYCPHCRHSLIDEHSIRMQITNCNGETGDLLLSPYLNVFTHSTTVEVPHGEEVADISCPHCQHSLIEEGKTCERCGSRIAEITIMAMSKLISFYICLKRGCSWHGISAEDTQMIALEDSLEW